MKSKYWTHLDYVYMYILNYIIIYIYIYAIMTYWYILLNMHIFIFHAWWEFPKFRTSPNEVRRDDPARPWKRGAIAGLAPGNEALGFPWRVAVAMVAMAAMAVRIPCVSHPLHHRWEHNWDWTWKKSGNLSQTQGLIWGYSIIYSRMMIDVHCFAIFSCFRQARRP